MDLFKFYLPSQRYLIVIFLIISLLSQKQRVQCATVTTPLSNKTNNPVEDNATIMSPVDVMSMLIPPATVSPAIHMLHKEENVKYVNTLHNY